MSRPIVSDAGPLIAFARAGLLDLLQRVTRRLVIPEAVHHEVVVQGTGRPGAAALDAAGWVVTQRVRDTAAAEALAETLGAGERDAIELCRETGACLLADGRAARREASALSIPLIGTLDILDEAKERTIVPLVRPVLDRLIRTGFRLKRTLYDAKLRHAGENP